MSYFPREQARTGSLSSGLLGKVFGLLAFTLAFAALGGVVGAAIGPAVIWPAFIAEIVLVWTAGKWREREGLNLVLLYAVAVLSGMTIGPLIVAYVSNGLGAIVLQAGAITGVMTAGLSVYALTTKRDFSGLAPYLFIGILGLVVASIIGVFIGGTMLSLIIGWVGAVLFSLALIYQVQQAKSAEDTMGNAVIIALGIYLNIVNLFLSILRILTGSRR